jgi:inosine triphosphate pyrophosphatase
MKLYFITSNPGKLAEIQAIIPDVERIDIDLPEIQDIDARKIIEAKLHEATKHHSGPYIVEDTSVCIDSLNGLPGPLIKWFLKTVGLEGIHKMTQAFGGTAAYAQTTIGYMSQAGEIKFFEGRVDGQIVAPRGELGFGWDAMFQPNGHDKTFGEMTRPEKNALSMRKLAAEKLREHLAS